jgi:hypothetical protein
MGRAGILPDITSTFSYWRKLKDDALRSGNWDEMSLALHHMNGALEIDYRIPTDNELWNQQKDDYIVWKCNSCTTIKTKVINKGEDDEYTKEIKEPTCSELHEIKIWEENCSDVIALLINSKTRKMWECPNCQNVASVKSVESQLRKYPRPHYRVCIYDEPERPLTGLMRRRGSYPLLMRAWGRNYSLELERQLAVYRIEYIKQNGHDMEDTGYKDKGD